MHTLTGPGFARKTATSAILVMVLAALVGCVSAPEPPIASLTKASDAIASAEQSDARQYAGAELDEARQKLMQAQNAVDAERMVDAERLAEQARVVAELATVRTAAAKASLVNRQLRQDADALDEEMKRMGDQQ